MTPERRGQIETIFYEALEHAPQARASYLEEVFAGDTCLPRFTVVLNWMAEMKK